MEDGTYEVSLFRRLHAKDWLKQAGQLSFRCYMIIMSTTWRKGIHHHLFGDPGCVQPPNPVRNSFFNLTGEKTCWQTPREGSKLTYSCHQGFDLLGPESYVCRNGTWKSLPSSIARRIDSPNSTSTILDSSGNTVFTRRLVPKGQQITVCSEYDIIGSMSYISASRSIPQTRELFSPFSPFAPHSGLMTTPVPTSVPLPQS